MEIGPQICVHMMKKLHLIAYAVHLRDHFNNKKIKRKTRTHIKTEWFVFDYDLGAFWKTCYIHSFVQCSNIWNTYFDWIQSDYWINDIDVDNP